MSDIEVNIKISDLEYVRFTFYRGDKGETLYLDSMIMLIRPTVRHKLKIDYVNSYSRLMSRDYGIKEEPDVPIEVQMEALRIARERITVKRWEDR